MIYAYIAGGVFLVYYLRRYWMTPWATFVSLSATKKNGYFLTVRHVTWYPPFLTQEATYYRPQTEWSAWTNAVTGRAPLGTVAAPYDNPTWHQSDLTGLLKAALAREAETEELLSTK